METRSLLSSQCDSKSHRPYRAFIPTCQQMRAPYTCGNLRRCVCVCLSLFVCAHRGACCASIFTASISDKPNESPESRYLPALSCSVLSSLFSHSVFCLLFSPHTPPHSLFVCLNRRCLNLCGGFLPPSSNKLSLCVLGTHITHVR